MSSFGWFDNDLLPFSEFDAEMDPLAWFSRDLIGFDDQQRIDQACLSWFDATCTTELATFDYLMEPLAWFGDDGDADNFPELTALALSMFFVSPYEGSPFLGLASAGASTTQRLVSRSAVPAPTVGAAVNARTSAYYDSTATDVFNPLSIAGCAAWYDLTHVTVVGGAVTALQDQSGNGRDITPTGAGLAYTASNAGYNGRPTMRRADATDLIQSPDLGITTGPFTIVFVGDEVPGLTFTFFMRSTGLSVVDLRSQTSIYRASEDGGATELDGAGTPTSPGIAIVVFNGASSRLYSTALTPVSGNTGVQPDMSTLGMFLGAESTASGSGDMNFTHALVYNGALSDADCKTLMSGFGTQAGIAVGP